MTARRSSRVASAVFLLVPWLSGDWGTLRIIHSFSIVAPLKRRHPILSTKTTLTLSAAAAETPPPSKGFVLTPSRGDEDWFDSLTVAQPVIVKPCPATRNKWQCYFYGRGATWAHETPGFLPTGWIGLAESDDGIKWTKVRGACYKGSVLEPSEDVTEWDGLHVGVGDVFVAADDKNGVTLEMYYFGGPGRQSQDSSNNDNAPSLEGIDMSIGRARSEDAGRTWTKLGKVLEAEAEEGLFCAWPKVLREATPWRMLYHSFDGKEWKAYSATSTDQGESWQRQGCALKAGEDKSWDDAGIGCRCAIDMEDFVLMVYEGVNRQDAKHRLGIAYGIKLGDGSVLWEKDDSLSDTPGGPILEMGKKPLLDDWTGMINIGTPCLVPMKDDSLRLYFVCAGGGDKFGIACVESKSGDVDSWKLVY